ncbi:uncharacterized protein TNCV_3128181 [Trichonephila clavipes]|nr:uncharacterized protein TNCV_3128181 [Trichonephila clavipes]
MLEAETIQRMEWPTCSPDLNPIEHVWDMLGRRIAARPRLPATVRDLEIALLEEWNSIPQSLIDNLIASMANSNGVFQEDNCTSPKSVLATGWLDEYSTDFSVINWPPRNSDLNPIERLWDVLEQGEKSHRTE